MVKAKVSEPDAGHILVELENCTAFDKSRLENKRKELIDLCQTFLGKRLNFNIVSENSPIIEHQKNHDDIKIKQAAFGHPLVQDAIRIFDGRII